MIGLDLDYRLYISVIPPWAALKLLKINFLPTLYKIDQDIVT